MPADVAFWDRIANDYARKPVADPSAFERKIAVTRERIRPGDTVLDVGCGTGSLALILAPHAAQVHGLDVSPEMTRIAREKATAAGVGNVTFHTGAVDETFAALADGSVDVLCAYSILHLVDDRAAALARLYRLLRPGGWLVASTVCLGDSWVPYAPMLTVMRWLGRAPSVSIVSRRAQLAEIERAGFVDLQLPDVGAKAEVTFLVARRPLE
jgi:arsenite methyltransferase